MSQSKTVIQGLTPDSNSPASGAGLYSRSSNNASRGTVVPGMENIAPSDKVQESAIGNAQQAARRAAQTSRPVVGFLYSVSRTPMGEYWPLLMGRNTIGQGADCDIQLAEGTVSRNHAMIATRPLKSGIAIAITDAQSTNGTMINGEMIGFSAEECHNGDIITIGNNYELLLIVIDSVKLGLHTADGFIPVNTGANNEDEDEGEDYDDIPFGPYSGPSQWSNGGNSGQGGTVGLDGSMSGNNHGGTVPI